MAKMSCHLTPSPHISAVPKLDHPRATMATAGVASWRDTRTRPAQLSPPKGPRGLQSKDADAFKVIAFVKQW